MCQLFCIKRDTFIDNTAEVTAHLLDGAIGNSHGSAALFINRDGEHSLLRTMSFQIILDLMTLNDDWDQVIIHQRFTTQGEATLANTHMWQVGDFFYIHNGILMDDETSNHAVDSQLIGEYLQNGQVWDAIAYCQSEHYANVLIINPTEDTMWMTRSETNSLFTDGDGQFSTRKLDGIIDIPVRRNSVEQITLGCQPFKDRTFKTYNTTAEKIAAASGTTTPQNGDNWEWKDERTEFTGHSSVMTPPDDAADELERLENEYYNALANGDSKRGQQLEHLIEEKNNG